jgi:hypothetical protein
MDQIESREENRRCGGVEKVLFVVFARSLSDEAI